MAHRRKSVLILSQALLMRIMATTGLRIVFAHSVLAGKRQKQLHFSFHRLGISIGRVIFGEENQNRLGTIVVCCLITMIRPTWLASSSSL